MSETETIETETQFQLRQMVAGTVDDLRRLARGEYPADVEETCPDHEEVSPVWAWFECQLEVVEVARRTVGGEWETTELEVLCCCGGPDLRVTFDLTGGDAVVVGRWGSDVIVERVHVEGVGQEVAEVVGVEA